MDYILIEQCGRMNTIILVIDYQFTLYILLNMYENGFNQSDNTRIICSKGIKLIKPDLGTIILTINLRNWCDEVNVLHQLPCFVIWVLHNKWWIDNQQFCWVFYLSETNSASFDWRNWWAFLKQLRVIWCIVSWWLQIGTKLGCGD